jgi:hypothetical protein
MIKHLSMLMAIVGLSFIMGGCGAAKLTPEVAKTFQEKAVMYTQTNMHYNVAKNALVIDTTNYQVGTLIPVNSEVTMQDVNAKQLTFLYKGQTITLRNIAKYSGLDISDVSSKYFSTKKVNLSKYSKAEQKAISSAGLVKGMSKEAVLLSLGTPPQHRTPNLQSDTWTYWRNRWTTFIVSFEEGKVISDSYIK